MVSSTLPAAHDVEKSSAKPDRFNHPAYFDRSSLPFMDLAIHITITLGSSSAATMLSRFCESSDLSASAGPFKYTLRQTEKQCADIHAIFSDTVVRLEVNDLKLGVQGSSLGSPVSGWRALPAVVHADSSTLRRVMAAAARYFHYLHVETQERQLLSSISVYFTKVVYSDDEYDEYLRPIALPVGPNICQDGFIKVFVDNSDDLAMYGLKLSNTRDIPLYVSVLFFDNDLSIVSFVEPSEFSTVTSCLLPHLPVTMGYGQNGGDPWTYFLNENQPYDVGYIKLFISKEPIDLCYILQSTPFQDDVSSGLESESALQSELAHLRCDTLLIPVVQRRV